MPNSLHQFPERAEITANILLGVLAAACIIALFNHGLVPSMEPRFAEVVREMIAAGEYIIPLKNGWPYVEYPVFYYWLAIAGKLAGLPMVAAIRLPTFLAFIAWLVAVGRWSQYLPTGLPAWAYRLTAAVLPIVLAKFSIAQTDGMLAFGVALAFLGYTRLIVSAKSIAFPWTCWIGVSIAMLAKGPVGIVCTLPIMFLDRSLDGWWNSRESTRAGVAVRLRSIHAELRKVCWIRGLALVALTTAPWYVMAGYQRGWQFVDAVLVYQNFDRYVTGYSHAQPWWYYFKTITYDFFPVSFLMPLGIWLAAKRFAEPVIRVVLIWTVFTFVFFTISGSKQGKYLLPMAPAVVALALLALEFGWRRYGRTLWRWIYWWSASMIAVFAALIVLVLPHFSDRIGGVDGFKPIMQQIDKEPGRLIHFQWPRSLTLYELGAPMPFVRSSRELYEGIKSGEFVPGDYVLAQQRLLGEEIGPESSEMLVPYPRPEVFEVVLETEIEKPVILLRIRPGAEQVDVPETPEPPVLNWRDANFDTD